MEQFSLEKYLANPSRKLVTGDGRKVKILCTNRKSPYPIVALVENHDNDNENVCSYRENGLYSLYSLSEENNLFFAPEKHEGWVNVYKNLTTSASFYCDYVFDSEEEAKMKSGGAIATVKIEWEEYNDKKCNYR